MFFLLRVAFWLGLVLVLLPSGGTQPAPKVQVSASEAMTAASAAVSDMRHFCDRQPQACSIGSQAAVAIGHRAQAGAKMLYEFLNEQLGPTDTGSVSAARAPLPQARPSQHTLTPSDVAPAWRGPAPQPQREARNNRPA
jgi:hypothetical protein